MLNWSTKSRESHTLVFPGNPVDCGLLSPKQADSQWADRSPWRHHLEIKLILFLTTRFRLTRSRNKDQVIELSVDMGKHLTSTKVSIRCMKVFHSNPNIPLHVTVHIRRVDSEEIFSGQINHWTVSKLSRSIK